MFKKLALPAVAMLAIVACDGAGTPPATDTGLDLEDRKQRGSYAQGYMLGQQGKGLPIDQDAFVQGVRDGLTDAGKLADDQLQAAVMDLQGLIAEGRVAEGAENRRAGEAFLAENAAREGVQVTASGLQYEVIAPGDGPRPTSSDTVTVHYRGTLIDGTEFDSSYSRNEPATFPLQGVIPGWTEALQLMPVGSTYKLCIPADLAYGDQVRPGGPIPPGSTLIFEVQLLGIEGQ